VNLKRILLLASLICVCGSFARAEDDDDFMEVAHRASQDTALRRSYPGARDEQNLEIQAALPQPTRSPDGTTVLKDDDGADLPTTAPSSD
jgi:hypothetical protein